MREAYGRVVYTYTAHLKKMNRLVKTNITVKCLQIVLSGISTGGFISSVITHEPTLTYVGGLFSVALLGLNLYCKDFNLADQIRQHSTAADNLWLIREQYVSLLTDFCALNEREIIARRDDLQSRTWEIHKQSPKTDSASYADAQKALKDEEEQFFAPEEIDKMIPAHLRNKSRNKSIDFPSD
jgi:hypothetical protein